MALVKIVYASMTGNTEEIADIVGNKFEELGHTVEVDECTTVDAADFEDADVAIVASYTYGDGELPDEIVDFYEDLADVDLTDKIFGVVGSGDTFYDYFCKAVDEFEAQFALTGATRKSWLKTHWDTATKGTDSVKVDLSAEDEDIANLEAFAETISEKVN